MGLTTPKQLAGELLNDKAADDMDMVLLLPHFQGLSASQGQHAGFCIHQQPSEHRHDQPKEIVILPTPLVPTHHDQLLDIGSRQQHGVSSRADIAVGKSLTKARVLLRPVSAPHLHPAFTMHTFGKRSKHDFSCCRTRELRSS